MTTRHLLLEQWSKGIATLAEAVSTPGFAPCLLAAVRRIVDFDFIMTFAYRGRERPLMLADTLSQANHQVIAVDYAAGPFLLDPFYQLVAKGVQDGCHRLHDVAPDHFRRSEYFRVHYGRTGIGEEIAFAFPMDGGFTGVTSFARWTESAAVTRGEMDVLRAIGSAVAAFSAQQWRRAGVQAEQHIGTPSLARVSHLGFQILSAREREIVTMILQGHSTESVALRLDISPGTVKIHRKNIYRKLKVSSQAELFAAFMGLSGGPAAYSPRDIPEAADIPQSRAKLVTRGGKP
jgi:DNA-binding CsgD family transcriptional regulator